MSMVGQLRYDEVTKEIWSSEIFWYEVVSKVSSQPASVLVEVVREVQVQRGDVLVEEVVGKQNKGHHLCLWHLIPGLGLR